MKTYRTLLAGAMCLLALVPASAAGPLAARVPLAPLSPAPDDSHVRWRGEEHPLHSLPAGMGSAPRAAIETWSSWVRAHGYALDLTSDGRLLLVIREGSKKREHQVELALRAVACFDQLLPAPKRGSATVQVNNTDPTQGSDSSYSYSWGAATRPVDTDTCVMFVVRDEDDYGHLVDELGRQQEYLREWVPRGKEQTGFVHQMPLSAAYIEHAAGMEEWDPDNELVHRVSQLLFVRRFSARQPFWIASGVAWHVEERVLGDIYCFPDRTGFVWATEHKGWMDDLRRRFSRSKSQALQIEELACWRRGVYEERPAKLAFGLVRFIEEEQGDVFSAFLEDVRLHALRNCRVDLGGGSWRMRVDYTVPAEEQAQFLDEHFGEDFFTRASEWLGRKRSRRHRRR